jgi:hypothetical protein
VPCLQFCTNATSIDGLQELSVQNKLHFKKLEGGSIVSLYSGHDDKHLARSTKKDKHQIAKNFQIECEETVKHGGHHLDKVRRGRPTQSDTWAMGVG